MVESVCHLLMKVYHVIVANFYVANMSLNAILENKIIAKISEFTVLITDRILTSATDDKFVLSFSLVQICHLQINHISA